jgi:hypothetical protein
MALDEAESGGELQILDEQSPVMDWERRTGWIGLVIDGCAPAASALD